MHDLDADVGVSGLESRLKLYILTSTHRLHPNFESKITTRPKTPGREFLSRVQNPLVVQRPAFLVKERRLGASGDMKQGAEFDAAGEKDWTSPNERLTHILEMLTMLEKVSACTEVSRVSKSHLAKEDIF